MRVRQGTAAMACDPSFRTRGINNKLMLHQQQFLQPDIGITKAKATYHVKSILLYSVSMIMVLWYPWPCGDSASSGWSRSFCNRSAGSSPKQESDWRALSRARESALEWKFVLDRDPDMPFFGEHGRIRFDGTVRFALRFTPRKLPKILFFYSWVLLI